MTFDGRRFLVPEVIQTSSMDCGPASLAALLGGYDVKVDFARLRDACQTDVDGTSIDTLDALASAHGLKSEQVLLPADFVLRPEVKVLPSVAVIALGSAGTHFVVLWRRVGSFVQVMDPRRGRSWRLASSLERDFHRHVQEIEADDYRRFFFSRESTAVCRGRLRELRVSMSDIMIGPR